MDVKRWLLIALAALFVVLIGLLIVYQYLSSSMYQNLVPIVDADPALFGEAAAAPHPDVEEITEEEYLASIAAEEEEHADEEVHFTPVTVENIYETVEISDRVYNVLLIGDDARINEPRGRSDTLMLLSYDRDKRTVSIMSFMRDMLLPTGQSGGSWARINTAYGSGGAGKAINTINRCFSLDIQRYAIVRFASVFSLIDALGGLELELTAAEAKTVNGIFPEHEQLAEGWCLLNGEQVLAYARMRHVTPDGDFGRTSRQRYVLERVFDRVMSSGNLDDAIALMDYMFGNIETNVPQDEMVTLATEVFAGERPATQEMRVPVDKGHGYGKYNGGSVITVDFSKNVKAIHEFLYGSSEGVAIPRYERPAMDTPEPDYNPDFDPDLNPGYDPQTGLDPEQGGGLPNEFVTSPPENSGTEDTPVENNNTGGE